ncbi:Efflux pump FUS6 [Hyphodiscus hymeniophilus]|uniref:Efflux pump FUS6 n=1 Tax=Hyphodiscus hymeniophilus TaxID=353542 RepID=A0A9P6VKY6_9HELO|nr:Efflux pump FUS6 [Hyphodiscus hymeniophilus]
MPINSLNFYLAFACLCICVYVAILDTVIIGYALPAIAVDLKTTSSQAYWCGTAYLISQTVVQPLYGSFSNIFGRKVCLMTALFLFTVASFLCAVAPDVRWLIGSRVMQGLESGGINVLVNVITADMVPIRDRGKYMGFTSLTGALGLVSGVVFGSVLAQKVSWRMVFYLNIPICIPTMVGISLFLNLKRPEKVEEKLNQIDFVGVLGLTVSLVSTL